ncbi:MAG: hypothetical protein JW776_12075 [Candidatus Lokiarchaeota archaeon]|nr:hypothetical protein [Candidatus Lokiarchaeota archaeon]
MFANRKIRKDLRKANISENEVSIIVHNLTEIQKTKRLPKETIGIIVHNIVKDQTYKAKFLADPKGVIDEANPQPSP